MVNPHCLGVNIGLEGVVGVGKEGKSEHILSCWRAVWQNGLAGHGGGWIVEGKRAVFEKIVALGKQGTTVEVLGKITKLLATGLRITA